MSLPEDVFQSKKSTSFLGSARVSLDSLTFHDKNQSQARRNKLEKRRGAKYCLQHVFQSEGCHRLVPENFTDAVITRSRLDVALIKAQTTAEIFKITSLNYLSQGENTVSLDFPSQTLYLNGNHRAVAVASYLDNNDRW